MIGLPPALDPWRPLLALLSSELAASLGPSIERLVLALGPLRAARPRPGGEPDGFSGIARRGSYERLLLSEWLLADEMPDEFARRATMGEHTFHAIARRSPAVAATSVALFDAGPDQLGSPRIAHLAALIALAGRAERAGARFTWGLLHDPEGAMIDAVTAESALHLVGGRTAIVAGDDTLRAWSVRAQKSAWEDVWIVGRGALPRLAGAAWSPASIDAQDVLDPGRRAVRVVVSRPPAPAREIELDLPDERACARLLRDPFRRAQAAPRRAAEAVVTSNLIFSTNGAKLFARGRGGEILAYAVPSSITGQSGRPKRYVPRARGVVVAVAWYQRALVMLVADERELRIELANGKHLAGFREAIPLPEELGFAVPTLADPLAPLILKAHGSKLVPITLDAKRALYEMSPGLDPPIARVAPEVSALCVAREKLSFVGRDVESDATLGGVDLDVEENSGRVPSFDWPVLPRPPVSSAWHLFTVGLSTPPISPVRLRGDGTFAAIYGFAEHAEPGAPLVAVQQEASTWTIHGAKAAVTLHPPTGTRVVGVYSSGADSEPQLLVLESDQRVISLVGRATSRSLQRASAEIQHVAQCTSRAALAYVTVTGEVVIHSLIHDTPLARYLPKEGS